ncbi:MAG: cyclic nucleotide-binding domain-containing protein [Cyclobacteriaceae bacterium]|nr:cyclic nucleotide-binding domain-containing protein [Cyclobacteriaceae bacterium]MCH8515081.1 cyclic nucleotide-binding domain-containing protein [Cyclobacteriaceae bacterium]
MNPFKRSYSASQLSVIRFLKRIRLFEQLSDDELALFIPYMYLRNYSENEVVFFRKDPSHALYIVKNGRVNLSIDIDDKMESLKTLSPYDSFGDNSLLDNTYRMYNAVVSSETADIYVIPQVNIFDIMSGSAIIKAKIMTSLSQRYNDLATNLFSAYRNSFGFFDLSQAYDPIEINKSNN